MITFRKIRKTACIIGLGFLMTGCSQIHPEVFWHNVSSGDMFRLSPAPAQPAVVGQAIPIASTPADAPPPSQQQQDDSTITVTTEGYDGQYTVIKPLYILFMNDASNDQIAQNLQQQAANVGANRVINFRIERALLGGTTGTGLAIRTQ